MFTPKTKLGCKQCKQGCKHDKKMNINKLTYKILYSIQFTPPLILYIYMLFLHCFLYIGV